MSPIQQMFLGSGSSGGLTPGNFYPMFAIKIFNSQSQGSTPPIDSADCEIPMQRALQFDESNTTVLDGSESDSNIKTILDASKYTINPEFKKSATKISGFRLEHWDANMSSIHNFVEAYWNGTGFNIYTHACIQPANLSYALPSQVGSITSCNYDGNAISSPGDHVYINCSSKSVRNGTDNWASDGGDYCFLGVSDFHHTAQDSDSFDTAWATTNGIAWGISDSDGCPSSNQAPMNGISRRSPSYSSLTSNWQQKAGNSHSGNTTTGYLQVKGKLI